MSCCTVELNLWLFFSPHTTSIGWIPLYLTQAVGQAWWDLHSKSMLVQISNGEPDTDCCVHSFGLCLTKQNAAMDSIPVWPCLVDEDLFSLLVLPHWRGVCGLRHQKPSTLRRKVLFNQTLTKKCCLDKLPKVKVTKRILSSRLYAVKAGMPECTFVGVWDFLIYKVKKLVALILLFFSLLLRCNKTKEESPHVLGWTLIYSTTRNRIIWKSCARWLFLRD